MPEQITLYHDANKISPFCHRVEIALLEAGVSFTSHGFDIYNKPEWFARANPLTGKVPVLTYGGPDVPPEEPSPLSTKIIESFVILELLADIFPNSTLLPPTSDPAARARVRLFIEFVRGVETQLLNLRTGGPEVREKLIGGLEKVQGLLPDATEGGEYAMGKVFTNADCAIVPLLAIFDIFERVDRDGMGKQVVEALAEERFARLRRYKNALWERESVKKVLDLDRLEGIWKVRFANSTANK